MPLAGSKIAVDISLDHRKRGLLWYATYNVAFSATYRVANPTDAPRSMRFEFTLPARDAMYDEFAFDVAGKDDPYVTPVSGVLTCYLTLQPGQAETVGVKYATKGMDSWRYGFSQGGGRIRDFTLTMTTDFADVDFPVDASSPSTKARTERGWGLTWRYGNLLSGSPIGLVMPRKLNPGPWVSRVTSAAPVSLFLFLFLVFVVASVRGVKIHPVNYFFISAGFFSFHLLLAYMVDLVNVHVSFAVTSCVSVFLVASYMRLVVGRRFAYGPIALSQFIYLVAFSYTFFLRGVTGLAVTVLCIATLFLVMQLTGATNWDDVVARLSEGARRLSTERKAGSHAKA